MIGTIGASDTSSAGHVKGELIVRDTEKLTTGMGKDINALSHIRTYVYTHTSMCIHTCTHTQKIAGTYVTESSSVIPSYVCMMSLTLLCALRPGCQDRTERKR